MVRGFYIAGTGMMLQRRLYENTTNNIVNADTTGYKKDYLVSHSFDDVLINRINDTSVVGLTQYVGPLGFGTQVDRKYTSFTEGSFEFTERTTDIALGGDAFFVMDTEAGELYTRCGAFYLNSEGYLIDGSGNYLMGTNGRVYVGSDDFSVNELGEVFVGGQQVNTLRLVAFEEGAELRKVGDNLYTLVGGNMTDPQNYVVKQGYLESSNVEIAREMVDMMTIYRAYETNQKMLTMIDETVGMAVNDIGALR